MCELRYFTGLGGLPQRENLIVRAPANKRRRGAGEVRNPAMIDGQQY
jgi:hypothetical protein